MNIHPLMIHFPIGLLATYSVFEFIRFKKVTSQSYWFYIKAILVTLGTISAYIAMIFGGFIEDMFKNIPEKNAIVPVHEMWATITTILFAILAVSYILVWVNNDGQDFLNRNPRIMKVWDKVSPIAKWVLDTKTSIVLAFLGLTSITITGALGAAMVHGVNFDPFVTFIYQLFFK